ncbi:hypothetical protein PIB30_082767 [Stylosanthes scabra]|uniref:Uncharacterized protein n=1 Tax=Stylosanthes scabra TaxID=79078 RepID=A0ABU6ZQV7_9FABA|nr:hypothetical protein [Stylosanthes scabra]
MEQEAQLQEDLNSALKEELQRLRFFTMVSLMGKQSLNSSKGRRSHSLLMSPCATSILGAVSINDLEPLSMYLKFMDELMKEDLEKWSKMGQIELLTELRRLTFKIIIHIFLGASSTLVMEALEKGIH